MGTKVKGLLKGLRHLSITNIFEEKEKEPEIQIGHPTDVKHVAHIGMDDANTTKPSWMEDYKAAPELAPQATEGGDMGEKQKPPKDSSKHGKRRDKSKDKDKDSSSHHRTRKSKDSNNLGDSEDSSVSGKHSKKKKRKGHSTAKSLPDSSLSSFSDDSSSHGNKTKEV